MTFFGILRFIFTHLFLVRCRRLRSLTIHGHITHRKRFDTGKQRTDSEGMSECIYLWQTPGTDVRQLLEGHGPILQRLVTVLDSEVTYMLHVSLTLVMLQPHRHSATIGSLFRVTNVSGYHGLSALRSPQL